MDLMTLQRRLSRMGSNPYGSPVSPGEGNTAAMADRIKDTVKRVNATRMVANRWGGKDYPIDVADYGQYLSTLQTLAWVMKDMGFTVHFMTRSGLCYDSSDFWKHTNMFAKNGSAVVACVCIGPAGAHYRISRDGDKMRVRTFSDVVRAMAPMRDGDTSGTKPLSASFATEIVRLMKRQSTLNPKDEDSLRKWGRLTTSLKPVTGGMIKNRIKIEFRKVR